MRENISKYICRILVPISIILLIIYFLITLNYLDIDKLRNDTLTLLITAVFGVIVEKLWDKIFEKYFPSDKEQEKDVQNTNIMPGIGRNPNFIGRDMDLKKIYRCFRSSKKLLSKSSHKAQENTPTVCLYGDRAVGKSQLSIEYAYKRQKNYKLKYRISANEIENIVASYKSLKEFYFQEITANETLGIVSELSNTKYQWLLIFDDAKPEYITNKTESISTYIPSSKYGHVLITSNISSWPANIVHKENMISVECFKSYESIIYIKHMLPDYNFSKLETFFLKDLYYGWLVDKSFIQSMRNMIEISLFEAYDLIIYINYKLPKVNFSTFVCPLLKVYNMWLKDKPIIYYLKEKYNQKNKMTLGPEERNSSSYFLEIKVKKESPEINELRDLLDDYPLALAQACSCIIMQDIKIIEYKKLYEKHYETMIKNGKGDDYPYTIATTWSIATEYLETECKGSITLLELCSFLDPDNIPRKIMYNLPLDFRNVPENYLDDNEISINTAIANLKKYSIIRSNDEMVSLHSTVQHVTMKNIVVNKIKIYIEALITSINKTFSDYYKDNNSKSTFTVIPHAIRVLQFAEKNNIQTNESGSLMISVARNYYDISEYKMAIIYYKKGLRIFENVNDKEEADCNFGLGEAHYMIDDYDKANCYYKIALYLYKKLDDDVGKSNCYWGLSKVYFMLCDYNMSKYYLDQVQYKEGQGNELEGNYNWSLGRIYYMLNNSKEAIECQEKALNIYEEINHKKGIANCKWSLARIYCMLSDYEKILKYLNESLEICKEIRYKTGEAKCYWIYGSFYYISGNYKKAIKYQTNAFNIFDTTNNKWGKANCSNELGRIHCALENYEKAEEYHKKSLDINKEIKNKLGEANCHNGLGKICSDREKYDDAIEHHKQASKLFEMIDSKWGKANCYYYLGEIYNKQNHDQQATDCYNEALEIYKNIGNKMGEKNCSKGFGNSTCSWQL